MLAQTQNVARYAGRSVPKNYVPMGNTVPEHQRNAAFLAYAAILFDRYVSQDAATALLIALNERNERLIRPDHPHTDAEVKAIVQSVYKGVRQPTRRQGLYEDEAPLRIHAYLMDQFNGTWLSLTNGDIQAGTGYTPQWIREATRKLEEWGLLLKRLCSGRPSEYFPIPREGQRGKVGGKCSKGFVLDLGPSSSFGNSKALQGTRRRTPLKVVK